MRITRHRRAPDALPAADLRLDDDFLDLPLTPSAAPEAGDETGEATTGGAPAPRRRAWRWSAAAILVLTAGGAAAYYLNLDPPLAVLSSEVLDFGRIRLAVAAEELAVELGNHGEKVLAVTAATLAGDASAEFTLVADGCSGRQVAPRQRCALRVSFAPRAVGARRARLEILTNAVNAPAGLALLGQGVAPELRAERSRLDFGEAILGVAGPTARLWLSNSGSAPLTLERVELAGLGAADFIDLADACSEQILEPGARCAVDYRFVPTAEGLRRAHVEIASDAPPLASPPWLVGVGLPLEPLLRLEPERLDFGEWRLGHASPTRVVTLRNAGDGPLVIRRWAPSVAEIVAPGVPPIAPGFARDALRAERDLPSRLDAREAGFELAEDGCTGRTLAPGETCAVEIRFRPPREGRADGFFEIEHSAREGSHALAVSGAGTAPHASIDPPRLSFGEVPVAARSQPRVLRLVNSGSGPLEVASVAVDGPDRQAFSPPASRCVGAALAAGASCVVEVRFRPRRDGPHRAELVLRHDADRGVHRLALNGLGVSARLVAEPERLDFGSVRQSAQRSERLVLLNRGRAAAEIRGLRLDGAYAAAFELGDDTCTGAVLGPGESCRVSVRFLPDQPGTRNAVLRVDQGSAGVLEVTVAATSREP